MQTLGISDATVRTEGRLKSLFWPSIQTAADVDYLGVQGYWVCTIVAALSFVMLMLTGHPITAVIVLFMFYVGGVGVRERSNFAAAMVLAIYAFDAFASVIMGMWAHPFIVVKIIVMALLIANVRATSIASSWVPDAEQAASEAPTFETLGDKFSDRFPKWLWPKTRIVYYVLSPLYLLAVAAGAAVVVVRVVGR